MSRGLGKTELLVEAHLDSIAQDCKGLDPAEIIGQHFPYRTGTEVAADLGISVDRAKGALSRLMKSGRLKIYPLPPTNKRRRLYFGSCKLPEITLEDMTVLVLQAIAKQS